MKNFQQILSGSLLIAGCAIGAGMLGIPLVTQSIGFVPAMIVTSLVWLFMMFTGFLFLEATLWMPPGANVLSISYRFLGKTGRMLSGSIFFFLYYCLMVAYFSAGAPLMGSFFRQILGLHIQGFFLYFLFGAIFAFIVGTGLKWVDRVNYLLMAGLIASYVGLVVVGAPAIETKRFVGQNWSQILLSTPVLFSAFGYHNVIPSLTTHFESKGRVMRFSIFFGTLLTLIVYALWQWLIIGAVPEELLRAALQKGEPVTYALVRLTGHQWIASVGSAFSFFAIVTSLIGVSFSIVDFFGDGLKMKREGVHRWALCGMAFFPPLIFSALKPSLFLLAIGIAGGFGEAFLNGILPVWLVWVGRYRQQLSSEFRYGGKILLWLLLIAGLLVMCVELFVLLNLYLSKK
jgi:tyrosine-specific transport protein